MGGSFFLNSDFMCKCLVLKVVVLKYNVILIVLCVWF